MATSSANADPAQNVAGAVIFTGYVLGALLLTMLIVTDLYKAYHSQSPSKPSPNSISIVSKQLQIYIALAVLSFSTLSFHMLNYLIYSYRAWATHTSPGTIQGPGEVLSGQGLQSIWQWLTQSTLFKDFAETICENSANYWWTQQALLVTMASALFISIEGSRRQVPHLWAYLAVGQILPISFAQNLFFVATLLFPIPDPKRSVQIPGLKTQCVPLLSYYGAVLLVPRSVDKTGFVPIIVLIRALLLYPLLVRTMAIGSRTIALQDIQASYSASYRLAFACSAFLFMQQTFRAFNGNSSSQVLAAINSNPAVSALGYDYLLYVISCCAYLKHGSSV
ncbi:MAG: hypothetical protein Q9218_001778 [Villophora microphyllina]